MSKNFSDLLVVWILWTDPFWMLGLDLVPNPVCQVRVEFTVWMETVTSFDHLLCISALHYFPFQNLHGWEIIVNNIKVVKFVAFTDDLLINFGQVLGSLSCESSDCLVCIEPSPARTNFQTVEEIIHIGISDVERVSPVMEIVVKQLSICQAQNHQMASLWNSFIQIIEQFENVSLELGFGGHSIERFGANIVSNEFKEHNQRIVVVLMSCQSVNVSLSVATVTSIYSDVLIIIVIAQIPFSGVLVEAMSGVSDCLCVSGVAWFVGNIQFVSSSLQKVVISGSVDHWGIEIFFWDWKVCSCWITDDGNSESLRFRAEFFFVCSAFAWNTENSIAIMIQNLISSFSTWIKVFVEFVAISSSPVISSEGWDISKGVIVKIEGWKMSISELVLENVNQPIPRSWLSVRLNVQSKSFHTVLENPAIGICAKFNFQTCHIWSLLRNDRVNYLGTCVVNEGLAGWLYRTIKESTKFFQDVACDIFFVVRYIIFKNSENNDAECAFIIKPIIGALGTILEVSVGTRGLESFHFQMQCFVHLCPAWMITQNDDIMQETWTILVAEVKFQRTLSLHLWFFHENLNWIEYFHGDWECLACFFTLVSMDHIFHFRFEMAKQVTLIFRLKSGQNCQEKESADENFVHGIKINWRDIWSKSFDLETFNVNKGPVNDKFKQ